MSRFSHPSFGDPVSDVFPPALPPKDFHPRGEDYRALRSRARDVAELTSRRQSPPPAGTPRMLVQVYTAATIPTCTPCVYLTHPVQLDADDVESANPSFVADTDQSIPVVVLGNNPNVGDYLVAHAVGGRWFAEKPASSQPRAECLWFCGAKVVFGGCFGSTQAVGVPVVGDGGQITGVIIDDPGAYCNCVPTVTFQPGPSGSGSGATGVAIMANSGVKTNGVIDNQGAGYIDVPDVTLSGGHILAGGRMPSGAKAFLGFGDVIGVGMTQPGSGYPPNSVVPATFSLPLAKGTQAQGHGIADQAGNVTQFVVTNPGSFYPAQPTVTLDLPGVGGTPAEGRVSYTPIGVAAITVSDPGYLVSSPPTVTIDAPPAGGTQATAHLVQQADCSEVFWTVAKVEIASGGSGYTDPTPPATLICTITGSGGGTYGPFTLTGGGANCRPDCIGQPGCFYCCWGADATIDMPGGDGGCPGISNFPIRITFTGDTGILRITLGSSGTQGYNCPPTTQFWAFFATLTCQSSHTCGPPNPPVACPPPYDDVICCNSVITCGCPSGNCPGFDGPAATLGISMPPCASRPYSGGATAGIFSPLTAIAPQYGAFWPMAGGNCGSASSQCCHIENNMLVCPGQPTLTVTISEP